MDTNIEYNQEYKAYKIPKIYSFLGFKYCKVDEVKIMEQDLWTVLLEVSDLKKKLGSAIGTIDLQNYLIEDLNKYKRKLSTYRTIFNIADYLYENSEDIRLEELILNLKEQIRDNPLWIKEFE